MSDVPHWRPSLNQAQECDRLRDQNAELCCRVDELTLERDHLNAELAHANAALRDLSKRLETALADRDDNLAQRWDHRYK